MLRLAGSWHEQDNRLRIEILKRVKDDEEKMQKQIAKIILMCFLFACLSSKISAQPANTWYVDDLGDGKPGSGSKEDPFRDLQKAIDHAGNGDIIRILPGIYAAKPLPYPEDLCGNCLEHRTPVSATRGFLIQGKGLHIIGSGTDQTTLITHAGYGVLFDHSRGSVITVVRITGGKRDPDGNATDAAVVAKFSTVQVIGVEILDNTHQVEGVVVGIGGVFGRENSELLIQGNKIQNNGWDGVALYRGANATIEDNTISKGRGAGIGITWDAVAVVYRNEISEYWKGIGTFGNSFAVVRNNAVYDNLGWGIIATGEATMEVSNNVIFHNGNCGFAAWEETVRGELTNNIIVKNGWRKEWVCPQVGIWMNADPKKNFPVTYNNVWGNPPYSPFNKGGKGDYRGMKRPQKKLGNFSVDPLFQGEKDFHFSPQSPLIDAGDPALTDPNGSRSDLGIYGGPSARIE